MVKLEEVEDETFLKASPEDEADWDTDSESDTSDVSDASPDESLTTRLAALKDILPPRTRARLSSNFSSAGAWSYWAVSSAARLAWLVGVSGMLVAFPFAVAQSEEAILAAEERAQAAQMSQNEVMAPGAGSASAGGGAGAAVPGQRQGSGL